MFFLLRDLKLNLQLTKRHTHIPLRKDASLSNTHKSTLDVGMRMRILGLRVLQHGGLTLLA